jgi:DNA-binding winged helix-turn-helix (wHTH) protein
MQPVAKGSILRFGTFELDLEAEQLLRAGRLVRLQPQPFRLLSLLASRPGQLVTREEIRTTLWTGDTFVDFDQGVNFAIRQIREALGDQAERPLFIETVPRRGYRFVAPITSPAPVPAEPALDTPTQKLSKLMWANISELRTSEQRRENELRRLKRMTMISVAVAATAVAVMLSWILLS